MQSQQPHNADQTRLDEIFKALRERKDLLADDEIRNIVGKEHSASTQGVADHQAGRALFFQRYFTRKAMLVSSVLASMLALTFFVLPTWYPTKSVTKASVIPAPQKFSITEPPSQSVERFLTRKSIEVLSDKQPIFQKQAITSDKTVISVSVTSNIEGSRLLELNEFELKNLGIIIDELGGIHQVKKRNPTGLELYAEQSLRKTMVYPTDETRLDFVSVFPPLDARDWFRKRLGKIFDDWATIGEDFQREQMNDSEIRFLRLLTRNQWTARKIDSVRTLQKVRDQRRDSVLAALVFAEIDAEQNLRQQKGIHRNYPHSPAEIVFVRNSDGSEWLIKKGKSSEVSLAQDFTDENTSEHLLEKMESAKSREESDSLETQLRRLYIVDASMRERISDSLNAILRKQRLQKIKDSTPTALLIGIKLLNGKKSLVLWCKLTAPFVSALPDRYRIPLERELAAAQKYSSLCEIPTREEREEVEQIIAGKPFLETWRSCSGALSVKSLSPNPAQNDVTTRFVLTAPRTVTAALHDIRGLHLETLQSGQNFQAGEHHLFLNLARHSAGMYLLVLTTTQGEQTVQRVLIEK